MEAFWLGFCLMISVYVLFLADRAEHSSIVGGRRKAKEKNLLLDKNKEEPIVSNKNGHVFLTDDGEFDRDIQ